MDKLDKLKQAEQFILKDMLYGTISGIRVKNVLETAADGLVKDDETVEQTAHRIITSLENINGEEKLYVEAHNSYKSPELSEHYVDDFINAIPYSGEIVINDETINIAPHLKNNFKGEPLDDLYRQLLINETKKVTYIDKEEMVLAIFNNMAKVHQDIEELLYNDKQFQIEITKLPTIINDKFEIHMDDKIYSVDDYMNNLYNKYSERRYNSVNSKPTLVETIGITRGEKDLEVTSSYVFLNDDERMSLTNNNYTYTQDDEVRKVYTSLLSSDSASLSLLEEKINKIAEIVSILSDKLVKEYLNRKRNIEVIKDNNDDLELMIDNSLNEIISILNELTTERGRTLELNKEVIDELQYKLFEIRSNAYDMDINMSNKIDQIGKSLEALRIVDNYVKKNENHYKEAVISSLKSKKRKIDSNIRSFKDSTKITERAAKDVIDNNLRTSYNQLLNENISLFNENEITKLRLVEKEEEYIRRAA